MKRGDEDVISDLKLPASPLSFNRKITIPKMSTPRVAINGYGRIGRLALRQMLASDDFEVVAVNSSADPATRAHLLGYDTMHGRFGNEITADESSMTVDGHKFHVVKERNPADLPWGELEVDIVLECTGAFRSRSLLEKHLEAGAKKVVLSAPAKDEIDATVVLGVNDDILEPGHRIVSNASCTTNCLAPVAKAIHDAFGIDHGLITTIHAYTASQNVLDARHKDLRRARACAMNIIPTTTGAARAVGQVLPELAGKLDGMAMRVPVANGSCVDLTCVVDREVTAAEVNAAIRAAAEGSMKGYLKYSELPLVSSDIVGDPSSSIFDSPLTTTMGRTVKIITWYDNEWGYSSRVVDLIARLHKLGYQA